MVLWAKAGVGQGVHATNCPAADAQGAVCCSPPCHFSLVARFPSHPDPCYVEQGFRWATGLSWHRSDDKVLRKQPARARGASSRTGGAPLPVLGHTRHGAASQVLGQPGRGKVLVVDGGGSLRCALLGDQIAKMAADYGWEVSAGLGGTERAAKGAPSRPTATQVSTPADMPLGLLQLRLLYMTNALQTATDFRASSSTAACVTRGRLDGCQLGSRHWRPAR